MSLLFNRSLNTLRFLYSPGIFVGNFRNQKSTKSKALTIPASKKEIPLHFFLGEIETDFSEGMEEYSVSISKEICPRLIGRFH